MLAQGQTRKNKKNLNVQNINSATATNENKKVERDKNLDRKESGLDLNRIERRIKSVKIHLKAIEETRKRKISMRLNLLDNYCLIWILHIILLRSLRVINYC